MASRESFRRGEKYLLEAIKTIERGYGKNSVNLERILQSLGSHYINSGEIAKAEAVAERQMALVEKMPGAAPGVVETSLRLLEIYEERMNRGSALALLDRFLTYDEKKAAENGLGVLLLSAGAATRAPLGWERVEAFFELVLTAAEKKYGKSRQMNPYLAFAGQKAMEENKFDYAEKAFLRQIENVERSADKSSLELANPLKQLTDVYVGANKLSEAEKLLKLRSKLWKKGLESATPESFQPGNYMLRCWPRPKKKSEADAARKTANDILIGSLNLPDSK